MRKLFEFNYADSGGKVRIFGQPRGDPAVDQLHLRLSRGVQLDESIVVPLRTFRDGIEWDIRLTLSGIPILSLRAIAEITSRWPNAIQTLPVTIDGMPSDDLKAANLLIRVDCLDEENSVFGTYNGPHDFRGVWKKAIKEEPTRPHVIFRVDSYPELIIASEEFKELVENTGLTGAKFFDVMVT